MNTSAKIDNLNRAILEFQDVVEAVNKDKKVSAGTNRTYNYATYERLVETIQPALTKCGLIYNHSVGSSPLLREIDIMNPRFDKYKADGESFTIRTLVEYVNISTRVTHATSGEYIECEADIPIIPQVGVPHIQVKGAAETYTKRYQLTALLGLITEDTDGNPGDKANIGDKNQQGTPAGSTGNKSTNTAPKGNNQSSLADKANNMANPKPEQKPEPNIDFKKAAAELEAKKAAEAKAAEASTQQSAEGTPEEVAAKLDSEIKAEFVALKMEPAALKALQSNMFAAGKVKAVGKAMRNDDKAALLAELRAMPRQEA
jgi:hypothetical protein